MNESGVIEEWIIAGVRLRPLLFGTAYTATGYYVGNNGSVWSRKGRTGEFRKMKQQENPDGYLRVTLWILGKHRSYYVHRLVLTAFVGACPKGQECCHGEGGQKDNRLGNVRWDTPKSNAQDRIRERWERRNAVTADNVTDEELPEF